MELKQYKRMRIHKEAGCLYAGHVNGDERMHSTATGQSDPFALSGLLERLADGKYGSVTKEFESIRAHNRQMIHARSTLQNGPSPDPHSPKPNLVNVHVQASYFPEQPEKEVVVSNGQHEAHTPSLIVCNEKGSTASHSQVPKDSLANGKNTSTGPVIIIDSDEEDQEYQGEHILPICSFVGYAKIDTNNASDVHWRPSVQYEKVLFTNASENGIVHNLVDENCSEKFTLPTRLGSKPGRRGRKPSQKTASSLKEDKENCENISTCADYHETDEPNSGIQNHTDSDSDTSERDDGLQDLWKEMSLATELSKDITLDLTKSVPKEDEEEECDHSYVLKDDLGLVCRICGIIQKSIEQIFDYQWVKAPRTTRTYPSDYRTSRDDGSLISGLRLPQQDLIAAEIAIHPRHERQMKPHQLEGFSFLVRNLVSEKPGGCILAHAPGSGKTFMLISFIQSFLAKYPYARPLVILPKGILSTWKKEFQKWQVEEIPLYDFYSAKADSRAQQLEVLKNWEENKSILFLGYKQFANIICECATNNVASACQERLLKVPSLLIIDEGHTPRNDNTNVLNSLSRVETPRKVVLSGTLFQNHVKEVFNILNLVRPHFMRMISSRAIIRRIQSRVHISGLRKICRADSNSFFFDIVEDTLQNDNDFKRRATVIQDLREMTHAVLHYYKGDFLDELPGLVDFTVLLKVSAKQKAIMRKLGRLDKFKKSSVCSAIFIHPNLTEISENAGSDKGFIAYEEKLDYLTRSLDIKDGVKTNFFLNILSMSDSAGEKMLVFSHYLLPLKFLEKLTGRVKGWRSGKEMFMILGDSTPEHREWSMEQFNNSPDAKVLFGSIKACGEGISLVGASRVVILDVHLNPSVSRQAIGRAFRPGQTKKVIVYRLVAADSPEEEDHKTSFRKELTSKMWFEWSGHIDNEDFELSAVEIDDSQDIFLGNPQLVEDIKVLYMRIT